MPSLHFIAYASQAREPLDAAALDALLAISQAHNSACGVTGALCYDAGAFIQYLEGPADAVEATFARIEASPLHRDLTVLSRGPVAEREFAGWHMAFCQVPDSICQALANADWEQAMPVTRRADTPNPGLTRLIYHWTRWRASGPVIAPEAALRERALTV